MGCSPWIPRNSSHRPQYDDTGASRHVESNTVEVLWVSAGFVATDFPSGPRPLPTHAQPACLPRPTKNSEEPPKPRRRRTMPIRYSVDWQVCMDAEASHAKGVAALRLRVIQRFRTGGRSHNSHNELKVITDAAVAKWLARHPDEALNLSIPLESELKPIGAAYRASF